MKLLAFVFALSLSVSAYAQITSQTVPWPYVPGGGSQVWTNDGTFIWPTGQPAPDATGSNAGPQMFFGGKYPNFFVGTNSTQDVNPNNYWYVPNVVSMTDSNEPSVIRFQWFATDNEGYGRWTSVAGYADQANLWSEVNLNVGNGSESRYLALGVSFDPGFPPIDLQSNNVSLFSVGSSGSISAESVSAKHFQASNTNAFILPCPDGGSFILTVKNDGSLNVVTNSGGL